MCCAYLFVFWAVVPKSMCVYFYDYELLNMHRYVSGYLDYWVETKTFIVRVSIENCINEEEHSSKCVCVCVCVPFVLVWGNNSMLKHAQEKKIGASQAAGLSFTRNMRAFFNGTLWVWKLNNNKYTNTHTIWREDQSTTQCIHDEFIVSVFCFAISAEWPTINQWPNQFIRLCVYFRSMQIRQKISFHF